jgi:hypothetical protein
MEEAMAKKAKPQSSASRRSNHPLDDWQVRQHMARLSEQYGVSGFDFPPLPWPPTGDTTKRAPRKGTKEQLVKAIAREEWPDSDGVPPENLSDPTLVQKLGDAFKERHRCEVSRQQILRACGRIKN